MNRFISINMFTTFSNQLIKQSSLNLQFSLYKYSLALYNLSHSHLQILGFQINPSSHLPFSINSLHSHLRLLLFQHGLLFQTLASNLHLHVKVSCQDTCLVSLVIEIRLNTLIFMFLIISGTQNLAYGSLILF